MVGSRQDMGDTRGGSSAGSSGDAVGDDLHRETTRNCGAVGVAVTNI